MNNTILRIIDTIVKIGVIVALCIAAATRQQYGYYNFIRWLVTVSFAYFALRAFRKRQFGVLILYVGIAILFNPIYKFWFQRDTWHLIDYLIAIITAVSVILDWAFKNKPERHDS